MIVSYVEQEVNFIWQSCYVLKFENNPESL